MIATAERRASVPKLKRYEFREPIGEGGAGTVYRAFDRLTQSPVAIKVLAAKLSEKPMLHRRLAVEFQAASALEHPNIVRALACDNDGEISYLVYELVDGTSLGVRIDEHGAIPEEESIRIITQMAQALHYAHERHIIHRDVKPDNILIQADGKAKLTDFGLAKDYENSQDLTRPASALGTPHFMAPEQFADAKKADARCDIYSLAATLYNMVTGRLPFDARFPLAILTNKELLRLPSPRSLVPELSQQVDAAIMSGLDPNPDGRPESCLALFKLLTGRRPDGAPTPQVAANFGGPERRAAVRFSLRVGCCAVIDPDLHGGGEKEESWPVVVRDISASGAGLLLARRFEPGTEIKLEVVAGPGGLLERIPAVVARVLPEQAGHWFHGCRFAAPLDDEQLQALLHYM